MTAIALVLATLLSAGPVAGDKPELSAAELQRAKDLFGGGQKFYKQGQFAEALAKFEEAYALRPHPVVIFNIAKCHEQLKNVGKALRAYRDYLRLSPDAKDKDAVNDTIANLERRLKERGQQQMLVFADPPNARIEIDGKDLGVSPASAELSAGQHKVAVRAAGYETVERTFTMSISRIAEMTINLKPGGPTPPIPQPGDVPKKDDPKVATLTPDSTSTTSTADARVTQSPTAPAPVKKGRVWTWVVGGVAVASAGAGLGMGLVSAGAANDLKSTEHSKVEAQALYDKANSLSTGANIAYGVAAGAAIAAVVLFFVEK